MLRFLVRVLINGIAIWLTALWLGGVEIVVGEGALDTGRAWLDTLIVVAVIAVIFTLVSMVIKPIVQILSIPFYILTLGLFHLVVNALMLLLTSWISGLTNYGLIVDGWWTAVLAALIISVIAVVLSIFMPDKKANG
jgi:putative membrane protein